MKVVLLLLVSLVSVGARAQEAEPKSSFPDKPQPIAHLGDYLEPHVDRMPVIPDNLVMVGRTVGNKGMWHIEKVGSCAWCSRPMTFKHAAFDAKMTSMWVTELGLAVADTEMFKKTCQNGMLYDGRTCIEGNFLLGTSRTQQYAIKLPIIFGAWMGTAYLRKGDTRYHIGGWKYWWTIPVVYQCMSFVGVLTSVIK